VKVELDQNNSGGRWWLSREQHNKLLAGGWNLPKPSESDGSPLAASMARLVESMERKNDTGVPYDWRHGLWGNFDSLRDAVESFERLTGADFFAEGCNCCGCPFSMRADNGEYVSGDSIERMPVRPWGNQ
jgi:hypothetical protein